MPYSQVLRTSLLVASILSLVGCLENSDKKRRAAGGTPAGSAAAASRSDGTGIVEGVVVVEGDPAVTLADVQARTPKDCPDLSKMYGLLFREGPGRTLADVFVGVTGYRGAAAPKTGVVAASAKDCAWDRRTYGMTAEQHLAIKSADGRPYVPALFGTKSPASLVAVPGGEAVPVFSKGPGMYVLVDEMRNVVQATVLVVNFPTFDVTGMDGKFRIEGVPVGQSKVSAFLPAANVTVEQGITVTKNSTTKVQLKLRFDAAEYSARAAAEAAARGANAPASSPHAQAGAAASPVQPAKSVPASK